MPKYTPRSAIYIILNVKNGHFYIGQSQNIRARWQEHIRDLQKGNHRNSYLQRAWNKYGEKHFKFKILEYCPLESLDIREQHYLDLYASTDKIYNIALNVVAPTRGRTLTIEHRKKISDANKQRTLSEETKRKIGESHRGKGHPHSDETKRKISASNMGKKMPPMSEDQRRKLGESRKGRKHSSQTRQKMSLSQKGRKITLQHREHLSVARSHVYNITSPDGELTTIRGLKAFCAQRDLNYREMLRVSNGIIKQHRGYKCCRAD